MTQSCKHFSTRRNFQKRSGHAQRTKIVFFARSTSNMSKQWQYCNQALPEQSNNFLSLQLQTIEVTNGLNIISKILIHQTPSFTNNRIDKWPYIISNILVHQIPKRWSMSANIALHPGKQESNGPRKKKKKKMRKRDMSSRRGGGAEEEDCDTENTTPMPAATGLRQSKRARRQRPAAGGCDDEVGGGVSIVYDPWLFYILTKTYF